MTDDNTPDEGTVEDTGEETSPIDALADILDDPDEDQDTEENEDMADDEADDSEDVSDDDTEEDEETDSEEDSDDEADDDSEDGPEIKGGRIAPQSAKVKLPDGSLTTVDELVKGYHRQSDYTRKSQENAELRKVLEGDKERVSQTAQQLQDLHNRAEQMIEAWKPQPPQDVQNDPMGWINYQQQLANWESWQQQLKQQTSELSEKTQAQQQEEMQQRFKEESTRLFEKIPSLADDGKRKAFFGEAQKVMGEYGFSPEEVGAIGDHRLVVVMRDLMRAKRMAAKAPEVKQKMKEKPKMVTGNKRSNPKAAKAKGKDSRLGRLRETGSRADGVRSLMDLDL